MVIIVDASDFFPEDPKENHYKQRLLTQNLLLWPDGCSSPPDTRKAQRETGTSISTCLSFFGDAAYMCCYRSRENSVPSPQKHTQQTHLLALKQVDLWRIPFPSGQFKRGSKCSVIASNQHRWIETNVSPSGKKYK